ncbi:MBL fold metallo-hydrolase [uncultured Jatrophihabitans sp.]|uniref:MBL fold metallo-hydrolase n=1 Tax=uncultured Jatrophihabitans sp. TaxID=1610747 RepID=UPI0035CC1584
MSAGFGPAELVEVADQVFAYIQPDGSWWINNTGFVVGGKAVISVDACSTRARTAAYLERIATVSRAPVTTLINTHHHGDHTFGNYLFGTATIVAHENCRASLLQAGLPPRPGVWDPVDWGDIELAPPTLTFTDRVTLWSDDDPIEVSHVGRPAHTDNDSLVWLPRQQVLFCGDLLFNGGTPFLLMGSVSGAIGVLTDVVAAYPAVVIVPGHGAPCTSSLIDTVVGYLRFVLSVARQGLDAGVGPLDAARQTDLGQYAEWLDAERIVGNLHRAYCDLDPAGHPLDIAAALGDMVAYNGGPLACYA